MSESWGDALGADFFEGNTVELAERLLDTVLVHETTEGTSAGRIVETEAYLAEVDPAAHSHGGRTARCASMFLPAGHAYVYLSYGVHHCFNVVAGDEGLGEAILVRALEPLAGLDLMAARRGRGRDDPRELCSGPGKVCQALAIGPELDGAAMFAPNAALRLHAVPAADEVGRVLRTPRIGITKAADWPLRFHPADNPWVSR